MNNSSKEPRESKKKVVIIGGGVGGMTLAIELSRKCEIVDITVIKKERHGSYSPCGMPFVLEGKIERMENVILFPSEFYIDKGIEMILETEVKRIDLEDKTIELDDSNTLNYDELVLATGRKPFLPPIEGKELAGVHTLSDYEDGVRLKNEMKGAKRAVIIGGGIIGLEVATAFSEKNIHTTVIEMLPQILPQILDPDMAKIVEERLKGMGIEVLTSSKVESIKGKGRVKSVIVKNKELEADLVLIATGVKPNADLAKEAGISIGKVGGIITDYRLNVKKDGEYLDDVFALGDCIEVENLIVRSSQLSGLASSAALQARLIVENICGNDTELKGSLNPTITIIGGLQIGSVGLTSHKASQYGMDFQIGSSSGSTRSGYYPGRKQIHIKLFAHDEKLIGAQMISEEDVKERVNAVTLAIQNGLKVRDLLFTERCYTPPLCLMTDPLIRALENLGKEET